MPRFPVGSCHARWQRSATRSGPPGAHVSGQDAGRVSPDELHEVCDPLLIKNLRIGHHALQLSAVLGAVHALRCASTPLSRAFGHGRRLRAAHKLGSCGMTGCVCPVLKSFRRPCATARYLSAGDGWRTGPDNWRWRANLRNPCLCRPRQSAGRHSRHLASGTAGTG